MKKGWLYCFSIKVVSGISVGILLTVCAFADRRNGKIYNVHLAVALIEGTVLAAVDGGCKECLFFALRVISVCAALYVLFLCKTLGAGDIKLISVIVGFLGFHNGVGAVFCGLLCASLAGAKRLCQNTFLTERLICFGRFAAEVCRDKKLKEYPRRETIRLGPYMLAGYGLYLLLGGMR